MIKPSKDTNKNVFLLAYLHRGCTEVDQAFFISNSFSLIKFGLQIKYSLGNFFLKRLDQFSTLKNYFENQNFKVFDEVIDDFGKSDDDMIY